MSPILTGLVGIVIGLIGFKAFQQSLDAKRRTEAESQILQSTQNAQREAENVIKEAKIEAKDILFQAKSEIEAKEKEKRGELQAMERKLYQREEAFEKKVSQFDKRDEDLRRKERIIKEKEEVLQQKVATCEQAIKEHRLALEQVAGITADEAKRQLLSEIESEARMDAALLGKRILDEAKEQADREAREIVTRSIQRITRDYVNEATISVVPLANDGMKGRIIGREGRNIRALEAATGVDLIIDETPEAVIVSGFDPLRREVAKIALERLMQDGRIHPTRIEEVVEKVKGELEKLMREEAEKVIFEVGLSDFHPEIVKLLGRLKYRTSYGQNNLYHAREASYICGIMAAELGLDVKLAKRGALLHDIGKVVSHEEEGTHALLGAEIAKKYGESEQIVNAIAAHHEQVEPICPESVLVAAAEALSAARPGARRETLEA
ncbi:MAG: ribonuclease Y, partial [Nitrospira sp.]|nr:ribonuclease Y [Nitrospira sp.]